VTKDCGSNDFKADAEKSQARTNFKGDYKLSPTGTDRTLAECGNVDTSANVNKSGFTIEQNTDGMSQTENQKYVNCYGWRSSRATSTYVPRFINGHSIEFSTGFKEFSGAAPSDKTKSA
jgi:hypothetical protein